MEESKKMQNGKIKRKRKERKNMLNKRKSKQKEIKTYSNAEVNGHGAVGEPQKRKYGKVERKNM